ncbi:MAG: hypothetical protein ACM3TR_18490 [Caulobacteraceae bacterium]
MGVAKIKNYGSKVTILLSIFFISVSLFIYQVVLTRLYSAVFSYHYVFLITSLAVLGLGIGSILAYKLRKKVKKASQNKKLVGQLEIQDKLKEKIINGSIILAVSFIAVFALNYLLPGVSSLYIYIILGTIPFLIGGYLYSILFTEFSGISGKLYFADLIGSGAGSLAVISLLNNAGMFRTVVSLCIIALIPVMILPTANIKIRALGYILPLVLITGFFLPGQYISFIEKNFNGTLNNPDKTIGSLKESGLTPKIVFSEWNAFSRTDVIEIPEQPDEKILTIDGAANAPMYKFNGDVGSLGGFKTDTGFLPFTVGSNKKTLLIGAGGGRDVLYAIAGGSKDITAVDINTASIDAVKAFGEYNGNIYNRPEVKVYGEDGRNFIRKSKDKYDMIFLSLVMTNASQGMGYALSENYIYTVEALGDYLDHLNENGKIAFQVHDEDDLSKMVATAIAALKNKGIPEKEAPQYISVLAGYMPQQHGGAQLHNPVLIIKNKPFTEAESSALVATAEKNSNVPLYTPLVFEEGVLSHIREAHVSLSDYIEGAKTNVVPATDDSPYFYNFGRGIPATLVVILLAVMIGGLILFAPFAFNGGNFKPTLYFGLLGIGFMMLEVPLIQKFILYLGHPSLAFTYVLAALLAGSGLGGYLSSNKMFNKSIVFFYLPPVMVALVNIILLLTLGFVFQSTSALGLSGRIIIAVLIMLLQGFFMGMPFPRGLKLIGESGKGDIIPVMWGVNGVTSVIGSVLSIILSMSVGFTGALIAGAAVYLIVSLFKTL